MSRNCRRVPPSATIVERICRHARTRFPLSRAAACSIGEIFCANAAGGLAGVAFASLLAQDGLLAGEQAGPWRPEIDTAAPLQARPPHFPAKAKRVLMIFCSGACSQVDTWDYKPELIKRDGKPMPGSEQLVTFQGQARQSHQKPVGVSPPRRMRQVHLRPVARVGQSGRRYVLHPLDDLEDQHARSRRNLHEHGVHGRGLSQRRGLDDLRPGERGRRSAGVCGDPRSARRAAGRSAKLGQRLSSRRVSGNGVQRPKADPQSGPARRHQPGQRQSHPRFSQAAQRQASRAQPRRHGTRAPASPLTNWPPSCSSALRKWPICRRNRPPRTGSTAPATRTPSKPASPAIACSPGGCLERGVRFVQVFNGAYAMGEGVGNWDGHKTLKSNTTSTARFSIGPPPRSSRISNRAGC